MHVLYFHQHFSTPQGAAGTRSYEMAQALLQAGHRVTMVCGSYSQGSTGLLAPFDNGQRRGVVDGIEVIEFELKYGNDMSVAQRLYVFAKFAFGAMKVALREPADTVFASSTPLSAAIPGMFAHVVRRKPFIFEVRDLWPELPKALGIIKNPFFIKLASLLEWISYHTADRLVGLSPGIVEGIASRGISRDRIAMVPNGCDLEIFSDSEKPWRPDGVKDNQLLAIFTGTHGRANGLDAVLDAAGVLKRMHNRDICIALVGQGSEKPRLQGRAKKEGLDNVLFMDPVPKHRLNSLMGGADIGLQTLRNVPEFYFGTSPNKFFDYLAAGLPVLNNYPGWVSQLIAEHNCGIPVEPDSPEKFANALVEASQNREALQVKGRNARLLAERQFSRAELSRQWIEWVTGQSPKAVHPNSTR